MTHTSSTPQVGDTRAHEPVWRVAEDENGAPTRYCICEKCEPLVADASAQREASLGTFSCAVCGHEEERDETWDELWGSRCPNCFKGAPQGTERELLCMICGAEHPVWYAPSELWNAVVRQPDGSDEWPFLCPTCFARKAEERGVGTAFKLSLADARPVAWKIHDLNADMVFWTERQEDADAAVADLLSNVEVTPLCAEPCSTPQRTGLERKRKITALDEILLDVQEGADGLDSETRYPDRRPYIDRILALLAPQGTEREQLAREINDAIEHEIPHPEHAQEIVFEGCGVLAIAPEEYERAHSLLTRAAALLNGDCHATD